MNPAGNFDFVWSTRNSMGHSLTSKENIVVNLIYEWLGEFRLNRTYDEYMRNCIALPLGWRRVVLM